ncbi:MAG: methylmalonyl Co-A mutase-associated GTPase MeaB [Myxococcota bacterium]|nr:methylmalonyl Co-A mutase-associated GTPase MeaB [Myxococcota bacterium]
MDLAQAVLDGHLASGARLIRLLEDVDPAGIETLKRIYPRTGRAWLVGVTGPPGAGKSTLVDALIAALRGRGRRVGVLAVDPTSPFSGGAILGDRVRMQRHATDPDVFIRSMATRGQLGGLALATADAALVLDAMGYDVVLVETVGVGQDELDVAELAHTTVVVNVPGLGDEIQAIKAGILEVGDVFVLNKADRPGADETEKQLRLMLHLKKAPEGSWEPPLLRTVARGGEGIEELLDACEGHRAGLARSGELEARAARRCYRSFLELLRTRAAERLLASAAADPELAGLADDVRARRVDPYTAADRVVARFGLAGGQR